MKAMKLLAVYLTAVMVGLWIFNCGTSLGHPINDPKDAGRLWDASNLGQVSFALAVIWVCGLFAGMAFWSKAE